MPSWKKTIFVNAIKARINMENKTADELVNTYPALVQSEKDEILAEINKAL